MPSGRPILETLNVNLDAPTKAALRAFCKREGVSQAGLIEAIARMIVKPRGKTERVPGWISQAIKAADLIDFERGDRTP